MNAPQLLPRSVLSLLFAAVSWLCLAPAAPAAGEPALAPGRPAPPLQTGEWVQGEPVRKFEAGKAYLVEFWATFCSSCRAAVPRLNEIQLKYGPRGLVVIGQNAREEDDSRVGPFVRGLGTALSYRVVLDDRRSRPRGAMAGAWLDAAGAPPIPTAFLVDGKGLVAWVGDPLELRDGTIESVLAGTYDPARPGSMPGSRRGGEAALDLAVATRDWDAAQARVEEIERLGGPGLADSLSPYRLRILAGKKDYAALSRLAADLSERSGDDGTVLVSLAWHLLEIPEAGQRDLDLAEKLARRAGQTLRGTQAWVESALARARTLAGDDTQSLVHQQQALSLVDDTGQREALQASFDMARFQSLVDRRDFTGANLWLGEMSAHGPPDPVFQNDLAWSILTAPGLEKRDLVLAERIALRAHQVSQGKNPHILDTLARALFLQGRRERAVELQTEAVRLAADGGVLKVNLQRRLDDYQAGRAPSEP